MGKYGGVRLLDLPVGTSSYEVPCHVGFYHCVYKYTKYMIMVVDRLCLFVITLLIGLATYF